MQVMMPLGYPMIMLIHDTSYFYYLIHANCRTWALPQINTGFWHRCVQSFIMGDGFHSHDWKFLPIVDQDAVRTMKKLKVRVLYAHLIPSKFGLLGWIVNDFTQHSQRYKGQALCSYRISRQGWAEMRQLYSIRGLVCVCHRVPNLFG